MSDTLTRIEAAVRASPCVTIDGRARSVLFFSTSDGTARAQVFTVVGDDPASAWAAGCARLEGVPRWLRVDWVLAADRTDWGALRERLGRTKRNYFRLGIALDADFEHAFLETELNANAMLYGGPRTPNAVVNESNFARYARLRHGIEQVGFDDDRPIWTFATGGVFAGEDGIVHPLEGPGRNTGRRRIEALDVDALTDVVRAGSDYLAGQVQADGRFTYGWHPCFDREIPAYNSLRHASSLYAMLEAWEVTRAPMLMDAIERALEYLTDTLIRPAALTNGREAAFLVDEGAEIKLGGNAVCLLALTKYTELTGDDRFRPLLDRLGDGVLSMQDADTGRFVHVLRYPSLEMKQEYRIIYYDGEAAFGLMRLYALTGDARWLAAVERAFAYFVDAGHWKAHDHWLGYAADALTGHRPDDRWFRFGLDNVRDHLDFVIDRITTFPTLLELMTAAARMVARLRSDPARAHLLDSIDLPKFYRAMHVRARYLMNGHFWPELAMFYRKPGRIAGSFFIRHHAFRVRIDDVEHYLSGLIAYRRYLLEGSEEPAGHVATGWTASEVLRATGGEWVAPPPDGWTTTGLATTLQVLRHGDMAVARVRDEQRGIPLAVLPRGAAAILTTAPELIDTGAPVLRVDDTGEAILALGRHARARMSGRIVGVTGSAGKTTLVAMLAHALGQWGPVGQTRANANLPHGIAWNLASMPWDTPHVVLELAIGRMAQNSSLTRPDVAVFTNILPAHLEFHGDLATIARRKSAIFDGMAPGGVAVLNRDMAEWPRVEGAALAHGLRIVTYGRSPDADFRLIGDGDRLRTETPVGRIDHALSAPGEHMMLNALAALATLFALGLDARDGLARLGEFRPLQGRGAETPLSIGGRRITLIDDAYNANPGSMAAAIRQLGGRRAPRRVAVLGEMLELGADAARYHTELAPLIDVCGIERVHVLGDLHAGLHDALPMHRRGVRAGTLAELEAYLVDDLADGDLVLVKGSHGSNLHQLVTTVIRSHTEPSPDKSITKPAPLHRGKAEGSHGWANNMR